MKKLAVIFLIALMLLSLQGCHSAFKLYDSIDDFDGLIENMGQNDSHDDNSGGNGDDGNDTDDDLPVLPDLDGFRLVSDKGFEGHADFGTSDFALVDYNGKKVWIDKGGRTYPCPSDVAPLFYNKYTFVQNGKVGLKDIHGEIVLQAHYTAFDIVKNTILAYDETSAFVFSGGVLKKVMPLQNRTIRLFDENILAMDGKLYDLIGKPILFGGCSAINIHEGIAIVKDFRNLLGYYDIQAEKMLIEPQYVTATLFSNGYAFVQKEFKGKYIAIEKCGEEKAVFNYLPCGVYDGYVFVEDGKNGLALYDAAKFENTGTYFRSVIGNRVYGDLIADAASLRFYSITDNAFITESFDEISVLDDYFVCVKDGKTFLYDTNLLKIAESESLYYSGGILSIAIAEQFYFYECINFS